MHAKKAEDRRFQGNQSLAHGNILFERYVFESLRDAHFFTHSREAPSLKDQVQDTNLASVRPQSLIKFWDSLYNFVTGSNGKGECDSMRHTLFKSDIWVNNIIQKYFCTF